MQMGQQVSTSWRAGETGASCGCGEPGAQLCALGLWTGLAETNGAFGGHVGQELPTPLQRAGWLQELGEEQLLSCFCNSWELGNFF